MVTYPIQLYESYTVYMWHEVTKPIIFSNRKMFQVKPLSESISCPCIAGITINSDSAHLITVIEDTIDFFPHQT
jgi:hypothetical protein